MNVHLVTNHKLLITIVKKGMAKKIVQASKEAGAEGATTLMGKGTATREIKSLWGISIEPEKEIIFSLIKEDFQEKVLGAIKKVACLDKPGQGIAFVIDIKCVAGICHICGVEGNTIIEAGGKSMEKDKAYELIVTIVNKGDSELVVEASKKAGAEGGTIIYGRGTGIHEQAKLFGITIEPEKELVLTLIEKEKTKEVLQVIVEETKLNKPGKGIAFILPVEQVAGINHLLDYTCKD